MFEDCKHQDGDKKPDVGAGKLRWVGSLLLFAYFTACKSKEWERGEKGWRTKLTGT